MSYKIFFKTLTNFPPYHFQSNVFDLFSGNKNIIIQAPTGSGKTWAAIGPFICEWKKWKEGKQVVEDCPRKLIYSLPLRTLANSLYNEVSEIVTNNFPELGINITLQTGENSNDEFFEGDIIFTTIDQTLSNVLGIPLSVPKKLANINAGAVLSAYLIFDEFHLLDPNAALKTTITLLELLSKVTPFCLMTATLSNTFLSNASMKLNAEIISTSQNDYKNFAFVKNNTERILEIEENIINAKEILNSHKKKSIVICNTVDRCIELYKNLQALCEGIDIKLICIHSRFFQKDRNDKENQIKELFGKKSDASTILISTQVIEVGLDISCDTMHTEISPINSFLQRIGRCARWGGKGKIFVYKVREENYAPYSKELSQATYQALTEYQSKNIDYFISQTLIENVLNEYEERIFNEIKRDSENTWQKIHDSWRTGNTAFTRSLIRDIRSINIVLLPAHFRTDSLYKFESISMNPYSLSKKVNDILDRYEGEQPNILMKLEESNIDFFDESNTDYLETKVLEPVELEKLHMENIVAINSDVIKYSSDFGLDFKDGENIKSEVKKRKEKFQYQIKMDTYKQHIEWMLEKIDEHLYAKYPLKKIQAYKYQRFDLNELIKFIIIMHDFGKLNNLWQAIVKDYQKRKSENIIKDFENTYLAHSDFDPNSATDKELLSTIYKKYRVNRKPEHSGIGAFVSECLLPTIMNLEQNAESISLVKVVTTTILRHHSAFSKKAPSYEISEKAVKFHNEELIKPVIPKFYLMDTSKIPYTKFSGRDLSSEIIQFNDKIEIILYFILVRVLRLCDQKSFELNK